MIYRRCRTYFLYYYSPMINYSALIRSINNELPKFHEWLNENRLSLNLDKTFALLFSNRLESIDEYFDITFNRNKIKVKLYS